MKNKKIFFLTTLFSFLIDYLTKIWARNYLANYPEGVNILGDYLRFYLVFNPHGVFSISFKIEELHYILPIIGIILILIIGLKGNKKIYQLAYGLILGGAIGNVSERIIRGKVTDFIDMGIKNLRWPTYNLADFFIILGILILLIASKEKSKKEN
ncbi:MAG: signal peptidase II [candidate division WOR-3 bacterium]|nr:signal peptidase II [candidate division WOR-3 bacterium]MCX7836944.1 signal peptidase II [candidate division WOR-3 bacterium]MDW8114146.1 signal peptidase II [candidate division WOR-3 bacterium]